METAITPAERITVALIPMAAASLAALCDRTGLSKTDIVNRALTLYEFADATLAEGSQILVRSEGGDVQQVKLL